MPVAIKLKQFGVNGTNTRQITDLTVDYADAASLPELIRVSDRDRTVWERTGGAASVNYRVWVPPVITDVEDKIIEQ